MLNPNRNPKKRKNMKQQHIKIKKLADGLYKLTPDAGYVLFNKVSSTRHSEAVVKEERIKDFFAVKA